MSKRHLLKNILAVGGVVAGAAAVVGLWSTDWTASLGGTPSSARLERIQQSSHWSADEETFVNSVPTTVMVPGKSEGAALAWLDKPDDSVPAQTLPVTRPSFDEPPSTGLRLTWLGHSTTLVEIDGKRILFDPMFSERSSPSTLVGPERFFPVPLEPSELPAIDAVVISHDHYDHLDMQSIRKLAGFTDARFLVPLGVGAHLERWGVAAERIRELDWWQEAKIGELTVAATPARHFSGRGIFDRFSTLWASWTLIGPKHRVFFSGDTGLFDGFKKVSETYGPFDVAMFEIGAYDPSWGQIHLGPEHALEAYQMMDAAMVVPVHWGTFDLGLHGWKQPIRDFVGGANDQGLRWAAPQPGGVVEPGVSEPREPWWESVGE